MLITDFPQSATLQANRDRAVIFCSVSLLIPRGAQVVQFSTFRTQCRQTTEGLSSRIELSTSLRPSARRRRLPMTRELTSVAAGYRYSLRYPPPNAPPFSGSPQSPLLPLPLVQSVPLSIVANGPRLLCVSRIGHHHADKQREENDASRQEHQLIARREDVTIRQEQRDREHTSQSDRPTHPGERRDQDFSWSTNQTPSASSSGSGC